MTPHQVVSEAADAECRRLQIPVEESGQPAGHAVLLADAIEKFLKALGAGRYSRNTLTSYAAVLRGLREHVATELGREPRADEIDRNAINSHGRERMKTLGRRSMDTRLYVLRSFFKWLEAAHGIVNPMRQVVMPRAAPRNLPGVITAQQVCAIVDADASSGARSAFDLRDRALIEVLYGSGIRISEAMALNWEDLAGGRPGDIRITAGKGGDDRIVVIGETALDALEAWRRVAWLTEPGDAIFHSRRGTRLTKRMAEMITRQRAARAGINERVYPHKFRHSFATSMMERGAGIADIGALLGHKNLNTTVTYTHVSLSHLQKQLAHHPRAQTPGERSIREFCELYGLEFEKLGPLIRTVPLKGIDWIIEENGERGIDLTRFAAQFAVRDKARPVAGASSPHSGER